ncbi:MAG TPA: hypothetical protein VK190_03200 [Pseudoneobacillus sp.]|nr:hypothetical protein [Pseudoneobacillus sp.]
MAEYTHVPGFNVNINDGGLSLRSTVRPDTESVLILAPAPKGPTDNPTLIGEPSVDLVQFSDDAVGIYGTGSAPNRLTTAFKQAFDAGSRNIYLMRLEDAGADATAKTHKMFMSLHTALDNLNAFDLFDHIVVAGLYSDDVVTLDATDVTALGTGYVAGPADIVGELAKFAANQIANNNEICCYIGAKPLGKSNPTLTEIRNHTDGLKDLGDSYNGFVSVVGGIDLTFDAGFSYIDNGVAAYAGLASTLKPHSATTNKVVAGAKVVFTPTLPMLDSLGDKKYVTFKRRNDRALVTLDITAAPDSSDYVLLSTARIILAAIKETRFACEPFLGEGADVNSLSSMETALHKTYKSMVGSAILDYDFRISMTQQDFLMGKTSIILEIIPALERRKITLDVTARAQF